MKKIFKIVLTISFVFSLFSLGNIALASPIENPNNEASQFLGNPFIGDTMQNNKDFRPDDFRMNQFRRDAENQVEVTEELASFMAGAAVSFLLFFLLVATLIIIANWKIYQKAGRKGWNSIVPIFNYYIMLKYILNRPAWIVILLFVPYVNIAVYAWMSVLLAKRFDKDWTFAVGLILLPFIFLPILAFGKAKFTPEEKTLDRNSPVNDFANQSTKNAEPEIEIVEEVVTVEVKDEPAESEPEKTQ